MSSEGTREHATHRVPPADDSQRARYGASVVPATDASEREGTDGAETNGVSHLVAVVFKAFHRSLSYDDEAALRNAFSRAAGPV